MPGIPNISKTGHFHPCIEVGKTDQRSTAGAALTFKKAVKRLGTVPKSSLKCQRRRKHIGKKTWSVTIVIFVRTGRQDWTQSVITSENSYSFMIFQRGVQQTVFDSQQLQRTFWLSRTLPSNFLTKRLAKNSESKAEGK